MISSIGDSRRHKRLALYAVNIEQCKAAITNKQEEFEMMRKSIIRNVIYKKKIIILF